MVEEKSLWIVVVEEERKFLSIFALYVEVDTLGLNWLLSRGVRVRELVEADFGRNEPHRVLPRWESRAEETANSDFGVLWKGEITRFLLFFSLVSVSLRSFNWVNAKFGLIFMDFGRV